MKYVHLLITTFVLTNLTIVKQINPSHAQSDGCFSTARSVFRKADSASASHRAKKFCQKGGDSICLRNLSERYLQETGAIMSAVKRAEKNCQDK